LALLKGLEIGYCCVDQPRISSLVPPVAPYTADPAYVRFHGRNAAKWFHHDEPYERYDYTYSDEEPEPWKQKIETLNTQTRTVLLYANNHWKGRSINTVRQLKLLLDL